ncbi:MAG: DNA mismatch repair endonuclease MutL [Clostridiales bacterium]|nr:DNA mismatch repair endonuclease MutL [Clostridiales bacterium]
MAKIRRLPKEVYDLIAAGEVVLGPASVVKELVENSIDAGAGRVTVEAAAGGIERVRVADNGHGIARGDVELAFAPHATSKLGSAEELSSVETLGFRGEALASIAAVSRVVLVTKAAGDEMGVRAETEGGLAVSLSPAGADVGTDICVERLFFNLPARKKHMGDARAEGRKVTEYMSKAAVSRPDIAFRLIMDGALVFATLGNGDRLAAIAAVYGSKTAEHLVPVSAVSGGGSGEVCVSGSDVRGGEGKADGGGSEAEGKVIGHRVSESAGYGGKADESGVAFGHRASGSAEGQGMRLEGYISDVLGLRSNRKGQHVFVNGRPVTNAAIEGAIGRAYREFAEPGRFPVVVLLLDVEPGMVDVNVHPAKSEISFVAPGEVADFVYEAIRAVLRSGQAIPKLRVPGRGSKDGTFHIENGDEGNTGIAGNNKGKQPLVSTFGGDGDKVDLVDINRLLSNKIPNKQDIVQEGVNFKGLIDCNSIMSTVYSDQNLPVQGLNVAESVSDGYLATLDINGLRVLAVLFATYILASDGEAFYIIDQHAAHERVNFERFRWAYARSEVEMQELLTPYLFTPPATLRDLTSYVAVLGRIGYEVDEFGDNTWAARTFPAFISHAEGEAFLLECLEALGGEDEGPEDISAAAMERIMMRACKAAVKANRTLADEECAALLAALSECANPYTCPHGRPVFLKLTRGDIERLFKRA